ncbi:Wzz/FepE/Etk N-terminal domain-containing protein [Streptomyces canus]|uniref:Wzz/FepE/Etk N-terminal domain-containing protein n=1 Tax=Streptomyces canus TaxID=58343 RepID=UPI003251BC3C
MDLAEIFRVMRRRWYILLPGLLLTIGLTVAVALTVPVTYQSQSTVVLLNSEKATKAYDGNPFLSTQTSLTGMADSLARNLNSDVSLRELKSRGATGTFEAKLADNAQGPLMWLTVTGTDKKAVLKSDRLLTEYADERLVEFQKQQSVTENARIRMMTIVAPQNPMAQTKTRLEYMIMAGGLGLVLSLIATFYVEARRRPRPAVRENEPAQPAAEPEPVTGAKESVAEQTMALRTPPSWSRSAEKTRAEGLRAGRNVMTVAPAAEALDEESTHGQRSHTGQRET